MPNRRDVLGVTLGLGAGCLSRPARASAISYDQAVRETWAPLRASPGARELVRAATLAANSHNTQPWIFTTAANAITIAPDFGRRCPAVDPDDHHLFASLGCAAENLVLAAEAVGLATTTGFADDSVTIGLEPGPSARSSLYDAITVRQCTRAPFDGRPVSAEAMRLLDNAGRESGVELILLTDKAKIAEVADYVVQGNTAQMRDTAFMAELKSWLRFSETDAVATRDGLFARHPAIRRCHPGSQEPFCRWCSPSTAKTGNIAIISRARRGSPCSCRIRMTRHIGWRPGAPASASGCRRPRLA